MYTYEIFETQIWFWYNILQDWSIIITQPYYPWKENETKMTKEEAISLAKNIILNFKF